MEEEELHENGGRFPLLLESDEDESLSKHNHMNEVISVSSEIVHMIMKTKGKELLSVQSVSSEVVNAHTQMKTRGTEQEDFDSDTSHTFEMQNDSFSLTWLCHGSTTFVVNEKQLLLKAAKESSTNEARYSKLVKHNFLHELTGAAMEIRSPSMPILQQTKAGDLTFYLPPSAASEQYSKTSSLISPACTNGIYNACKTNIGNISSKDRDSLKAKSKGRKMASFALDSDTSDDDGMQDEYVDDGFIVFGDVL